MVLFSVIIPTCDRNDLLGECLNNLFSGAQTVDISQYEVIVSDDSKRNGAKDFLKERYSWVRWVEGPKKGPASNRNNGAKYARGEWLVFTDDDCLPSNSWLNEYLMALDEHEVYEGVTIANRPKQRFDEEAPINLFGGCLWSCNFMIKKSFFFDIDGFDELFPYPSMEDIDMSLRIKKRGPIKFVPAAKVIHPWRVVKPFMSYRKRLASHVYFAKKNGVYGMPSYRYMRTKIFVKDVFMLSKELFGYSFRGTGFYFERLLFDVLMIFI